MADKDNLDLFPGNELNGKEMERTCPYANPSQPGGGFFEIHVRGQLNSSWSEWLENLEMKLLDRGEMILYGPIRDQAALMGVLNKLYRLNLALLSVKEVNEQTDRRQNEYHTNHEHGG